MRGSLEKHVASGVVREVPKNLFYIVSVKWRLKITKVDIIVDEQWNDNRKK